MSYRTEKKYWRDNTRNRRYISFCLTKKDFNCYLLHSIILLGWSFTQLKYTLMQNIYLMIPLFAFLSELLNLAGWLLFMINRRQLFFWNNYSNCRLDFCLCYSFVYHQVWFFNFSLIKISGACMLAFVLMAHNWY